MSEHKHKRESVNITETDEDSNIVLEPAQIELGSGYTLAVSYDENQKPIIEVKTYGHINLAQLQKEIEALFPDAQIRRKENSQTLIATRNNARKRKR